MRGDVVYRVYGVHEGREKDVFFGAFRCAADAEANIRNLRAREMHGRNWSDQYHNRGFVIREAVVETDFEVPPLPKPRDKYCINSRKVNQPGTWDSTIVEVFRRTDAPGGHAKVGEYKRNYALLQTFEPFRQGNREFALISPNYTRTSVLDLESGCVVAEEQPDAGKAGFCPVGFYVPDWWDVNKGSTIPGSPHWSPDCEWPTGDFGFVWGCVWGDDSSWKIQYLDLSGVQHGVVRREERFGYVELATFDYVSPCLNLDLGPSQMTKPPPFISISKWDGVARVTFAVEMQFGLESGKPEEWQRLRIANFE